MILLTMIPSLHNILMHCFVFKYFNEPMTNGLMEFSKDMKLPKKLFLIRNMNALNYNYNALEALIITNIQQLEKQFFSNTIVSKIIHQ